MRESCTYGSVRGARGNSRPYRDPTGTGRQLAERSQWGQVGGLAERTQRGRADGLAERSQRGQVDNVAERTQTKESRSVILAERTQRRSPKDSTIHLGQTNPTGNDRTLGRFGTNKPKRMDDTNLMMFDSSCLGSSSFVAGRPTKQPEGNSTHLGQTTHQGKGISVIHHFSRPDAASGKPASYPATLPQSAR